MNRMVAHNGRGEHVAIPRKLALPAGRRKSDLIRRACIQPRPCCHAGRRPFARAAVRSRPWRRWFSSALPNVLLISSLAIQTPRLYMVHSTCVQVTSSLLDTAASRSGSTAIPVFVQYRDHDQQVRD